MSERENESLNINEEAVLQEEVKSADLLPVPVTIEGAVETRQLPAQTWSTVLGTTDVTGNTQPKAIKIVDANPRRSRFILKCNQNWHVRTNQPAAISAIGNDTVLQAQALLEFRHQGEIWVAGDVAIAQFFGWQEMWTR